MDNHSVTYEDHVYLAGDYYNHIWKPDIYFPDAVDLRRPIILEDDSVQLRIDSNMTILYSMRLIVETRCRMEMNLFPLDQQNCPICVSHVSIKLEMYPGLLTRLINITSFFNDFPRIKLESHFAQSMIRIVNRHGVNYHECLLIALQFKFDKYFQKNSHQLLYRSGN